MPSTPTSSSQLSVRAPRATGNVKRGARRCVDRRLHCLRDSDEIHAEVKGSSTDAVAVELTDGAVQHWRSEFRRSLLVVDRISWKREEGGVTTSGGRLRVWHDWTIDSKSELLVPTRYRYTLPHGAVEPG